VRIRAGGGRKHLICPIGSRREVKEDKHAEVVLRRVETRVQALIVVKKGKVKGSKQNARENTDTGDST